MDDERIWNDECITSPKVCNLPNKSLALQNNWCSVVLAHNCLSLFFFILSKNLWKHFCYLPWLKKFSFKINVLSIFQFSSSRLTGGLAQNPIYLSILRVPFAFLMTQRLSTCRFVFFVTSTIVQKFHYIM